MAEPIVFIVGAGGSNPYGFPTGKELLDKLINQDVPEAMRPSDHIQLGNLRDGYKKFQDALLQSGLESIDTFLAHRKEFAGIGKTAIAAYIAQAEAEAEEKITKDWLSHLYNRFLGRWSNICDWPVQFITFNYDRIIEASFANMIANTKNINISKAWTEVDDGLDIVHVYGKLERDVVFSHHSKICLFGGYKRFPDTEAQGIRVVGEERESLENLQHAKDWICRASTRIVLGFGFDQQNCQLLGMGTGIEDHSLSGKWVSTAYGMLAAERSHIKRMTNPEIQLGGENDDCLHVLRDHLNF